MSGPTYKRTDGNSKIIDEALTKAGCRIANCSNLGNGFPDRVVAFFDAMDWVTCLMEYKVPGETLTPAELKFWLSWPGLKFIVYGAQDALQKIGKAK